MTTGILIRRRVGSGGRHDGGHGSGITGGEGGRGDYEYGEPVTAYAELVIGGRKVLDVGVWGTN